MSVYKLIIMELRKQSNGNYSIVIILVVNTIEGGSSNRSCMITSGIICYKQTDQSVELTGFANSSFP